MTTILSYTNMLQKFLVLIGIVFTTFVNAQTFPVQVTPQLVPPHSVKLSDYATINSEKLFVNILLTDVNEVGRRIRLKMYVEGQGLSIASQDIVAGAAPIFVDGGVNLRLSNVDLKPYFELSNLVGITPQQYNNPLPNGGYNYCFEVYDYFTGRKLSTKSCTTVFLIQNDPPILNLPFRDNVVDATDPQNILFTWTPRHTNATNVQYEFTLKEIWDTRNPQATFLASVPFYQTTTRTTTLLVGPEAPQLIKGKVYGWQVRAFVSDGVEETSVFKNDGGSEIFWFKYIEDCRPPSFILSQALTAESVKIEWQTSEHLKYNIQYRKKGFGDDDWFEEVSYTNEGNIYNLEADTVYEFRVGGECTPLSGYAYANILEFTTPSNDEAAYYNCGLTPEIDIKNTDPLPTLGPNDTFTAGDFPVIARKVTGGNGTFSGWGYITLPFLENLKEIIDAANIASGGDINIGKYTRIKVKFDNVKINTSKQLIDGVVQTSYDADWGGILDADEIIDDIVGNDGQISTYDASNMDIKDVVVKDNGDIVIIDEDGNEQVIVSDVPVVITDQNGDQWTVDEEGNVTEGSTAEGGQATSSNTNGVSGSGDVKEISSKDVSITFVPSGVYGTDKYNDKITSDKYKKEYEFIKTHDNKEYPVLYKLVSDKPDATDIIKAEATFANGKSEKDIVFKTKQGSKVETTWSGTTATLNLKRQFDFAKDEIIATVKPKDSTGKYDVAGKLNTWHVQQRKINLTLVSVDNAPISNIGEKINEIYNKAGVHFTISEKKLDIGLESLDVGDSDLISNYTSGEKSVIQAFKDKHGSEKEQYYMFFLNNSVELTKDLEGFMPLKRQFGFVFKTNDAGRVAAHELGHGIFGLKHPFSQYDDDNSEAKTDYLMDYGTGTQFSHMDWQKLHAPGIQLYWFQGDEAGEHFTTRGYFKKLKFGENKDKKKTFTFLTPSAQFIVLPNNVKAVTKFYGYYGNSFIDNEDKFKEFMTVVPGTLKSFKLDEKEFKAKITKSGEGFILEGYFNGNEEYKESDYDIIISKKNNEKAIIFAVEDNKNKIGYNALLIESLTFNKFVKDSKIKSPIEFPYEHTWVKEMKSIKAEANGSQHSYNSEALKWAFELDSQTYSKTDNTLLIRNKLLEFKTAYPRFLEEYAGNKDNLPKSWRLCSDYSLPRKNHINNFEDDLRKENCECVHGSPIQTGPGQPTDIFNCTKKEAIDTPKNNKEWLTLLYVYLDKNSIKINEEIFSALVDYNTNLEKIKTDTSQNIAYIINIASQNDIGKLGSDAILSIISKFVNETFTPESSNAKLDLEGGIIKLIKYANKNISKELLEGIEKNNIHEKDKVLSEQIFYSVDDSFLFFGSDNRKKLVVEFTKKIFDTPKLYDERLVESVKDIENRTFIFEYTNFVGRLLVELGNTTSEVLTYGALEAPLSEYYQTETIDKKFITDKDDTNFGKIKLIQKTQSGFRTIKIKDKSPFKVDYSNEDYFKPFDLIFFTNKSNLSSAKAYENEIAKKDYPIPAMAVAYISQAGENQTTADGIFTAIDIASLAVSGTPLMSTVNNLSKAKKIFYTLDVMSSVASVSATGISDHAELNEIKNVLNTFSAITGVASMGDIVSGVKIKNLLKRAKNSVDEAETLASDIRKLTDNINKIDDYKELNHFVTTYEDIADKYIALALKDLQDAKHLNDLDAVKDIKKAIAKILDAKNNKVPLEFINKAEELINGLKQVEPAVTSDLISFAHSVGGKMEGLDFKMKTVKSLARKLLKDGINKPMNDVLRYTTTLEEAKFTDGVFSIVKLMRNKGYEVVNVKNTFEAGSSYKGINANFRTPSGKIFELQFHTPKSFDVKQNVNHSLYEKWRKLDPESTEAKNLEKQMMNNSNSVPNPKNVNTITKTSLRGEFIQEFVNKLKQREIFEIYDTLTNELQILFRQDFLNASDDVLDALKNNDSFEFWKTYRKNNPSAPTCK